jgi:branched-chain amino acid transport system substrate-binding protein
LLSVFVRVLLVAFLAPLALACGGDGDEGGGGGSQAAGEPVDVGAILPLTGALSSYGETSRALLDEAVTAVKARSPAGITLVVEDSTSVPAVALQKLQALHARGIRVVIGPYSSSEVNAVREFAGANGMILLSPLSTARSLAIPGDNIFRFTPDDEAEGAALAALAWADGVRTLVAVTRDDDGNKGLQTSVKTFYERLGGTIVTGLTYGPNETDFTDEAQQLNAIVNGLTVPRNQIGVYLTAFGEVNRLFDAVDNYESLAGVKWYGSDSVALSKDVTSDAVASRFAIIADYPNPILGLRDADKPVWGPISDRVQQKLSRAPDAFALGAFDALLAAHAVITAVGGDTDTARLRTEIMAYTGRTTGLTGPLQLNEAGDRALGSYDFWSVCERGSSYSWRRSATFTPGSPAVRVNPLPPCT